MHDMAQVTLNCLSPESAKLVAEEIGDNGKPDNYVMVQGSALLITYYDKRFPLDLADWAGEHGHASDTAAAQVIGSL